MRAIVLMIVLFAGNALADEKGKVALVVSKSLEAEVVAELVAQRRVSVRVDDAYSATHDLMGLFDIERPVPGWASEAMNADWAKGTAACRAKAGPPPYGGNQKALFCGMDLAKVLWQRELERVAPHGEFLAVVAEQDFASKKWSVVIRSYRADESQERSFEEKNIATSGDASRAALSFVRKALAGGGKPIRREIVRDLPVAPADAPTGLVAAQFPPVPEPPACRSSLPSELRLTPADSQAALDLARLWKISVGGAGSAAPRACSLVASEATTEAFGSPFYQFKATLTCDNEKLDASAQELLRSKAEGKALSTIVGKAFDAWCK